MHQARNAQVHGGSPAPPPANLNRNSSYSNLWAFAQAAKRARSGSSGDGESSEPAASEFAPSGVFAEEGLGGEGGADGEGRRCWGRGKGKGKGGGAPRPPQLLRRHEPCTDTTPMDTEAFLAHLQKLSWYKVRRICPDAILVSACAACLPEWPAHG